MEATLATEDPKTYAEVVKEHDYSDGLPTSDEEGRKRAGGEGDEDQQRDDSRIPTKAENAPVTKEHQTFVPQEGDTLKETGEHPCVARHWMSLTCVH